VSGGGARVAAYGFFGIGNLGNEASLTALLAYLRERHPDAALSCFGVGAEAVERDHGVPARQLMTYARHGRASGRLTQGVKALSRLWDIPRTFAMVGAVDVVVVPGTGALETQLGVPPWGLPFWLFLVAVACRLRRRKLALVSVGAQYAAHPVTRFFYRTTVRLAHFVSFRDRTSAEVVRAMGVQGPLRPVYPDLAFSLPTPDGHATRAGHVAIGVMAYYGKADDPVRGAGVRRTYVERMASFVTGLLDTDHTVTLLIGDLADREVAHEVAGLVRTARPEVPRHRLEVSGANTLDDILADMAYAEVVVASRFHNLIAALKLAKPTVSLGYAKKNADLLAQFGLGDFTQGMDNLDVTLLTRQVVEVEREHPAREADLKDVLHRFDGALEEQFTRLSAHLLDGAPTR
jgi:polysaccharide pyruvyl transferase WcaK-like protein